MVPTTQASLAYSSVSTTSSSIRRPLEPDALTADDLRITPYHQHGGRPGLFAHHNIIHHNIIHPPHRLHGGHTAVLAIELRTLPC